jgi:hypothetical protein
MTRRRNEIARSGIVRSLTNQPGEKSDMRNLVLSASAALLLSTGLAFAQGSGAAGDIGSGPAPRATSPAPTVGQSATAPTTPAPPPKAAKKSAKKKK